MTVPADKNTPLFDRDGLRKQALERLRNSRGPVGDMPTRDIEALVHELEVHHVELEVQNEELRRAQNNLVEARNEYRDLYEFAPIGYLSLDPDGVIRLANLTAANLCGRERREIIGARLETLVAPADRDACYLHLGRAWETQDAQQGELRFQRPDGSGFYAAVNTVPILAATPDDGGILRMTLTDITARKEKEALHHRNADLEQRAEERRTELSRRTEQLRQLTLQLTLAEEQERRRVAEVLHDNQQQLLAAAKFPLGSLASSADEHVKRAAAKAEALIDQAIACARSLTDELSPPVLYYGKLLPAMEWLADWMWQKHEVSIHLDTGPFTEPETENTRVLLFRCARELLFNVVKHAGVKEVEVRLRDHNGETEIMVSDQGVGFDPQNIDRKAGAGGGFGLFAIRERMELLGGKLEIESAPGQGSRFTLRAPRTPLAGTD